MKVTIEEIDQTSEEEIIIRCYEINENILNMIKRVKEQTSVIIGYKDESIHRINASAVYYIESVDNKTFLYCKEHIFESKQKLYELEELYKGKKFLRVSKSTIINMNKIISVKPSLSGRFEAKFDNGENIIISRQYVPLLKKLLGI
jgi:DNA-binding LytR/AlgR family response regulator